ncbi:MAG: hypothetical protein R2873_33765 [Caldilineaceae bacterium]
MFRQWGVDVIGQNIVPEITLAAELELCYAGLVTIEHLSADQQDGLRQARCAGLESVVRALPSFVQALTEPVTCGCGDRLNAARRRGLLAEDSVERKVEKVKGKAQKAKMGRAEDRTRIERIGRV